jgi:hypothetical protein
MGIADIQREKGELTGVWLGNILSSFAEVA